VSFPRYPRYKPSGVEWLGDVPAHWDAFRGRFCAAINPRSQRLSALGTRVEVSFLAMEAIGDRGALSLEQVCVPAEMGTSYTEFDDGDVLIAKITPCFENGKGALATDLVNGAGLGTSELHVLRSRGKLLPKFLYYVTMTSQFRNSGEGHMYGAGGQKRVPTEFIRNLVCPVPPREEQHAIVRHLDRETANVDMLLAEQLRLLELLREKRQAVISHTVTKGLNPDVPMKPAGIEWIGDVPAHWDIVPLKYVVEMRSGGTPDKGRRDLWDGDVPWASAKDLKSDRLGDTEDHLTALALEEGAAELVSAESVLVVVRGMILARTFPVALTTVPMSINQDLKALIPSGRLDADYLAWLLRGTADESRVRVEEAGHGTKVLRMDKWAPLPLPIPPVEEQEHATSHLEGALETLAGLATETERAVCLLEERRAALISAAVTGQIDVRGLVAQEVA
jgi:type I restriction enzyme, S subunit